MKTNIISSMVSIIAVTIFPVMLLVVERHIEGTPEELYKASRQLICVSVIAIIALIILAIVYLFC